MALPPGITAIPEWFFYTLLGGTILAIAVLFLLILIFMWTPAGSFIKAKFKNLPVFLMTGRDGVGGFYVPEFSENQYAHFKKAGTYAIARESYIFDRKSKQPIYIADKDIGVSIQKDWPEILAQMQTHFPKMKSGKDYIEAIKAAETDIENVRKNPSLLIKGATIKVSDLAKFYPMNIRPTHVDEYAMIAVRRDRRKQNSMQFWAIFSIVILMTGIAGYMLIGKVNEGKKPVSCSVDLGNTLEKVCPTYVSSGASGGLQRVNGTMQVIEEVKATPKPGATLS